MHVSRISTSLLPSHYDCKNFIPVVINVVFFRALFHNMKQLSIILSENESTSVSFYFMGRVQLRFNKTGQRYNSFMADVITSLECT